MANFSHPTAGYPLIPIIESKGGTEHIEHRTLGLQSYLLPEIRTLANLKAIFEEFWEAATKKNFVCFQSILIDSRRL